MEQIGMRLDFSSVHKTDDDSDIKYQDGRFTEPLDNKPPETIDMQPNLQVIDKIETKQPDLNPNPQTPVTCQNEPKELKPEEVKIPFELEYFRKLTNEGITWFCGKVGKAVFVINELVEQFGSIEQAGKWFVKSWWGIKNDLENLKRGDDSKNYDKIQETSIESRMECLLEAARRKLLIGSEYGYYYLIPYGKTLTLSITQHGIMELLIAHGIINHKKDFNVIDVFEGDDILIDRSNPRTDKFAHCNQTPFKGNFLGCLAVVNFPDKTTRVFTRSKSYFDEARKKSKCPNGAWSAFYLNMCHKTIRKSVAPEIAANAPDVSAAIAYDNRTQYLGDGEEVEAIEPQTPQTTSKDIVNNALNQSLKGGSIDEKQQAETAQNISEKFDDNTPEP